MNESNMKKYLESADYIRERISISPKVGIILGSGLGKLADSITDKEVIPYAQIPNFLLSTAPGHQGNLIAGRLGGKEVICMQGRFHYYEGKDMEEVVLPVRALKILGVKILILTNAAGGINTDFRPGDLMLITDLINLSGGNPLRGKNDEDLGPRFPDMSYAYDPDLRDLAMEEAKHLEIPVKTGIYAMMQGPSFETPAEIRMLRVLGADAVGMSTVPEVITAVHAKMKVLGISCITNMAAGILKQPLTHQEVIETANQVKGKFIRLINAVVAAL